MSRGVDRVGRVLVLGGTGMLGHKVFQSLAQRFSDTWCAMRGQRSDPRWQRLHLFEGTRVRDGLDAMDLDSVDALLRELRPSVVVNCVGAIKQRAEAQEAIASITLNALLPHRLTAVAQEWGARIIHFSTDCVFSGAKGRYTEEDQSDVTDLYGMTKHLGEVANRNAITLRTSFIGRELHHHQSLLDWFLAQEHTKVRGYRRVWWSGVTSNHLADVVAGVIENHQQLSGLYHVSSGRISKYELLLRLRDGLDLDIEVTPDDSVECDRSLEGQRFEGATGYRCPPWDELIKQLARDPTPYESMVGKHGVS